MEKIKGKNVSHKATDESDPYHLPRHCSARDIQVLREWITKGMNKCSQQEAIDFYKQVTGKILCIVNIETWNGTNLHLRLSLICKRWFYVYSS